MNGKFCILIWISFKFVPKHPIDNQSVLVQCWTNALMDICSTQIIMVLSNYCSPHEHYETLSRKMSCITVGPMSLNMPKCLSGVFLSLSPTNWGTKHTEEHSDWMVYLPPQWCQSLCMYKMCTGSRKIHLMQGSKNRLPIVACAIRYRADSRLAPNVTLQSNAVSHWLGTNLESARGKNAIFPVKSGSLNILSRRWLYDGVSN